MTKPPSTAEPPDLDRRDRIKALERKVQSLHRSVLEKTVLQGQLPIRATVAAARSRQSDAVERERRFLESSSAYRQALATVDETPPQTRVTRVDSLTWWVPLTQPDDEASVARALRHQDFPYRAIAQTREVAIGGLMLDLGANTGRMSIPRVILGDVTAAYCAEPDPMNYACLVRNVRGNQLAGQVMPDHLAIGADCGTVRLERGKSSGGHRVVAPDERTAREVIEVASLTLDAWVDRLGIDLAQLAFVKVDVQGSEVGVFQGATRTLEQRHVAWQVEVDLDALSRRSLATADLLGYFRRHFSHFVDLSRHAVGERVRPVEALDDALRYLGDGTKGRTDLLLFTMDARFVGAM